MTAEEGQLTDETFMKALCKDVEGVRSGVVQSMTDAMRPALKDRPWGPRHKVRDKHGKAF
jgi:hypothetical protein